MYVFCDILLNTLTGRADFSDIRKMACIFSYAAGIWQCSVPPKAAAMNHRTQTLRLTDGFGPALVWLL